jgi:TolB-like protein
VNPKNFFAELKRRNVYRAAVAYGVVAWFLTQLTTQVFPFFEIPNSAVRFVVIALAVGFPIAMLLSWLYELTPEGIVRTEDLHPVQARSIQRATGRILDFIIIGALLLVISMLIVGRLPFYGQTSKSISQKSIAVLPFDNQNRDPEIDYLSDGIPESIIHSLSQLSQLKVMARSTVFQYKGKEVDPRKVGHDLGVGTVVMGRLLQQGDNLTIQTELVNVSDGNRTVGTTIQPQGRRRIRGAGRDRERDLREVALEVERRRASAACQAFDREP